MSPFLLLLLLLLLLFQFLLLLLKHYRQLWSLASIPPYSIPADI